MQSGKLNMGWVLDPIKKLILIVLAVITDYNYTFKVFI